MVYSDSASRKERCCSIPYGCQRPVRGEASLEAKAYVGRRPTPKALETRGREGWREGGDSRGKRVRGGDRRERGQRPPLPQGEALRRRPLWKSEASPPAGRSSVSASP